MRIAVIGGSIFSKLSNLQVEKESAIGLSGFILLLHIGTHPDRQDKFYFKFDSLITELEKRGYSFQLLF